MDYTLCRWGGSVYKSWLADIKLTQSISQMPPTCLTWGTIYILNGDSSTKHITMMIYERYDTTDHQQLDCSFDIMPRLTKTLHGLPFVKGIHWWRMGSYHKRPVVRQVFSSQVVY